MSCGVIFSVVLLVNGISYVSSLLLKFSSTALNVTFLLSCCVVLTPPFLSSYNCDGESSDIFSSFELCCYNYNGFVYETYKCERC